MRYRNAFLADSTYKTNRYGLPLLNIVGIFPTKQTFNACFTFMISEKEKYYIWAISQFKEFIEYKEEGIVILTDREL